MSVRNSASEFKKLRGLMAMAMSRAARVFTIIAVATNRAFSSSVSGTVVAAAGAIVPGITITPVKTGKFRVSAWLSYAAPGSSGTARAALTATVGGVGSTKATLGPTIGGGGVDVELDGFTVGTPITFAWVTIAADSSVTLGEGSAGAGAGLMVQELL